MPYDAKRKPWAYYGVTVDPITASDGSGIRWSALVDFPGYAGYLKADTKEGMRELIRHYSGRD